MPQPSPITDLSGGELSPRLRGRFDTAVYTKGAEYIKNYLPIPFGGVTRRPGSYRIHDITTELDCAEALMIPFKIRDYSDIVMAVWQTGGYVYAKPIIFGSTPSVGTTISLATTYPGSVDEKTKWAVSEDGTKIFLAGYRLRPITLTFDGTGSDGWSIGWTVFDAPEWDETVYYNPGDIVKNTTYFIAIENTEDEPNLNQATSTAAYWSAYANTVLPDFMTNATAEATALLESDWYPSCVGVYLGRLVYGGSPNEPTALWGSKIRESGYFVLGLNSDSAWKHTLAAADTGAIQWLVSGDYLVIGTEGGEFVVGGGTYGITPTNVEVKARTAFGSSDIQALLFNEQVMFAQSDSQQVRAYSYLDKLATFHAAHINAAADHIYKALLKQWGLSRTPRPVIFSVDYDGHIIQFDYNMDMGQASFVRWENEDDTHLYKSIGVLSASGDDEDHIVVIVKRGSNYYVETFHWIDYSYHTSSPMGSSFDYEYGMYLDSATEITVLEDSEGFYAQGLTDYADETLDCVVDNAPHEQVTVSSLGVIRLTHGGSGASYVGYNYESVLKTMNLSPALVTKRTNQFAIRFIDTVGGNIGPSYDELEAIIFRDGVTYYDTALPLFSGDHIVDNVGGFSRDAFIWVSQNQPLPQTILMIAPWLERWE